MEDLPFSTKCKTCLDSKDVGIYEQSTLQNYLTKDDWENIDKYKPFTFDPRLKQCNLNCAFGYHSNFNGIMKESAIFLTDQKCIYDGCLSYEETSTDLKKCTKCWTMKDIDSQEFWVAHKTYGRMKGWKKSEPFKLDANNKCLVQCDTGYWANPATSASFDTINQRCTANNCESWDYDNFVDNNVMSFIIDKHSLDNDKAFVTEDHFGKDDQMVVDYSSSNTMDDIFITYKSASIKIGDTVTVDGSKKEYTRTIYWNGYSSSEIKHKVT